jgi:hypothetical protein
MNSWSYSSGDSHLQNEPDRISHEEKGGGLSHFLHDEQKVHAVNPEETHRDIRDDRNDLAFQTVQKLLQFALIARHSDIKAMDAIFCWHIKLLSF